LKTGPRTISEIRRLCAAAQVTPAARHAGWFPAMIVIDHAPQREPLGKLDEPVAKKTSYVRDPDGNNVQLVAFGHLQPAAKA
jgi:hypothetical protein